VVKPFGRIVVVAGLCIAATACASNAKLKEDMLSASGFKATPPKTQAQIASFNSLRPHKLTKVTHKGNTVWIYSDPPVCGCLYIGDQKAHDVYVQKLAQQTTSDMNALTGPDNPTNMDFSPWVA
jgi:hypothetical protein